MRGVLGLALSLLALSAGALEVVETPRITGIDDRPLEQRAADAFQMRLNGAKAHGELGCKRYCGAIRSATQKVLAAARAQGELGRDTPWQVQVISSQVPEAYSMPGGRVLLSEGLIAHFALEEAEIAFVVAHEVAHGLLQHERQTLAMANAIIQPRGISRSVEDLYFQMGYDFGLMLQLQPLLKATEMEADQAGLLLGAMAGYRPDRMLGFLRKLAAGEPDGHPVLATHPDSPERLANLRKSLPLAWGIWHRHGQNPGSREHGSDATPASPRPR